MTALLSFKEAFSYKAYQRINMVLLGFSEKVLFSTIHCY